MAQDEVFPINNFKQTLSDKVMTLLLDEVLSDKEKAVLGILVSSWGVKKIKQRDIRNHKIWKKAYRLQSESSREDTVIREVRRAVRSLRVKHGIPVLHDKDGHFLPQCEEDINLFVSKLENEAKCRAAASIETYKVMKAFTDSQSTLFEHMDSVGDQIIRHYR